MDKKRNKLINAILFVILIITIGIIIFLAKSDVLKPKDKEPEVIIPNSGYKTFEVEGLETKLKKLSFSNKKQDFYNKSSKINVNTNIKSGKVSITIKYDNVKRTYEVDKIENAVGVHTNAANYKHITYIVTEDGKVYKIEDDLNTVKETENYKGEAVDLGLTNVVKIAIDKSLKFKINSELTAITPCVYIKTDDDRYFTDESIYEGEKIVELIEKKVEETNENASENN